MKTRRHRSHAETRQQEASFFSKKQGSQPSVEARAPESFFQPKLEIGQPGDRLEQEANSMADAVVNRSRAGSDHGVDIRRKEMVQLQTDPDEEVQTKLDLQQQEAEEEEASQRSAEEEEAIQAQVESEEPEDKLQRQAEQDEESEAQVQMKEDANSQRQGSNRPFAEMLSRQGGRGDPLPAEVRAEMEPAFGADLGAVRVHTDEDAACLSRTLGAQAFTHGYDIYFNNGKFDPASSEGKHLLAHELTHTRQQQNNSR